VVEPTPPVVEPTPPVVEPVETTSPALPAPERTSDGPTRALGTEPPEAQNPSHGVGTRELLRTGIQVISIVVGAALLLTGILALKRNSRRRAET